MILACNFVQTDKCVSRSDLAVRDGKLRPVVGHQLFQLDKADVEPLSIGRRASPSGSDPSPNVAKKIDVLTFG